MCFSTLRILKKNTYLAAQYRTTRNLHKFKLKIYSKMTQNSRLIGRLPKIGIRPVIDGREMGVRESLEIQTMNMAKAAAKFIEENLRFPSGEKVECVIADTTIGGVADAAYCADKFEKEGVGVSLTVTPCWCYGTEVMDTHPSMPKAVWGFNGTERPGAVYLAAALAGYSQKGLPAFGIYGRDVQDAGDTSIPADVQEKLLRFTKAALASAQMKGKSYLSIGYSSMGIAGSMVDPDFFQEYLGIRTEFVESVEFIRRIEKGIFDQEEYTKAMAWTKANCAEGEDTNRAEKQSSRERKDWEWEVVVKMTLIARDLMVGNPKLKEMGFGEESKGRNAILGGFQGQRQWTDYYPNADFTEAIMNSSFDWNGIREAYVFATENDSLNGVSMLFGHLLTNTAQIFSDVRTFWSADAVKRVTGKELTGKASGGIIHLINSGSTTLDATARQKDANGNPAMKPFWDITEEEAASCLENTSWCPADLGYFRGGGYSSLFKTAGEMPVTMSRLNLVKGIGPVLQIAEGWTVELPDDVHEVLDKRTNPTWPTTWFVPRLADNDAFKDVYSVMANWGANHGAISYGHIGADLITLASILRIPVNMHNVNDDQIFRPSAWSAFGTDKEGADYRACATYGPLYK
jgi:L-fucose/D-arabinose isomerase